MDNKKFVSRGGIKLQFAIENWKLRIENCVALDVGSSTGGFVDCLLQNGASKVYSVDTAYGELAWKLRNNPRVVVMERTNILYLDKLPKETSTNGLLDPRLHGDDEVKVDLVTIDAGWTKLELVLPVVKKFLKANGQIIALLKPHYEAKEGQREKGVVKSEDLEEVVGNVINKIKMLGFDIKDQIESPILGSNGKGNKEFILLITLLGV